MALVKRSNDKTKGEEHDEDVVDQAVSDQKARMSTIIGGIAKMDEDDNEDDWTASDAPKLDVLHKACGIKDITSKERDEAWEEYQKNEEEDKG